MMTHSITSTTYLCRSPGLAPSSQGRVALFESSKRPWPDARTEVLDLAQPSVIRAIQDIFDAWAVTNADDDTGPERAALIRCLDHSLRLGVRVIGIYDKDTLIGYNLVDGSGQWQIGGFQKSVHGIPGLSVALWHAGFEHGLARGVRWDNGEQDLGIAGLRQHKAALRPQSLLKKCTVRLR